MGIRPRRRLPLDEGPTEAPPAEAAPRAPAAPEAEPGPSVAATGPSWPPWAWMLVLLVVVALVWAPSLQNGFTMDDRFVALAQNDGRTHPLIAELHAPSAYFGRHYWADHAESSQLYRPITVLSFALRHALFGDSGAAAHLANLLLHLLAVWLSYLLIRGLGAPPRAALLGAAVFGLHALRSEVVASVVGRAELLAFVCGAGGLLLLLRSRPWKPWPRVFAHLGSSLLLFLALCSKESAIAWLPFIVVYDLLQRRILFPGSRLVPPMNHKRIADTVILVVPIVCFLFLRHRALGPAPAFDPTVDELVNPLLLLRTDLRVLNAIAIWGHGLLLTLVPHELSADYGAGVFRIAHSWSDPVVVLFAGSLLALGGLLYVGLRAFRTQPLLSAAALSFLGFQVVTSNVPFAIGTIFGERLYYTPALGLSFFAAFALRHCLRTQRPWLQRLRPGLLVVCGMWFGLNLLQIQQRIPVFRDDPGLFAHESLHQPRSARMRFCVAGIEHEDGRLEQSARSLEAGLLLYPGHLPSWIRLGRVRYEQGLAAQSVRALERGLTQLDRRNAGLRPELYGQLALAYAKLGQDRRARAALSACRQADADYARAQPELIRLERLLREDATGSEFPASPDRR